MTTNEAAEIIGCSERNVRTLIQAGKLKARYAPGPKLGHYVVSPAEARRVRDLPQNGRPGWKRGRKRVAQRGAAVTE